MARPHRRAYRRRPDATEDELTWQLIEEMAVKGAELLLPVFEREGGREGAALDPDESEVLPRRRADHRAGDPVRRARAEHAGEGAGHTRGRAGGRGDDGGRGHRQCDRLLHGAAGARGRRCGRARAPAARGGRRGRDLVDAGVHDDGRPTRRLDSGASPTREAILVTPGTGNWSGIACFKRAYAIFQERGYRARLLAAAYRHHLHWSEMIGGDVVLTIPLQVAAALQRLERRGDAADRAARAGRRRRRALRALRRTSAAPTSPTA